MFKAARDFMDRHVPVVTLPSVKTPEEALRAIMGRQGWFSIIHDGWADGKWKQTRPNYHVLAPTTSITPKALIDARVQKAFVINAVNPEEAVDVIVKTMEDFNYEADVEFLVILPQPYQIDEDSLSRAASLPTVSRDDRVMIRDL